MACREGTICGQALHQLLRDRREFGGTMRRRLEKLIPFVLPIIVLATFVQAFAPVAAFRMVAYAISDPLYLEEICAADPSSDAQALPSNAPHSRGKCSGFCSVNHAAAPAVPAPAPIFVALQRQFERVSWLQPSAPPLALHTGSNAQARAPPSYS